MRPDEFAQQKAGRWARAEAFQQAYRRGLEAGDLAQAKAHEHQRKQQESQERLRQKVGM